jgi:hypothetical protein
MRHDRTVILIATLLSAIMLLSLQCSRLDPLAGTATQSGNGCVVGTLLTVSGAPAAGTQIKLFPADYDPVRDGVNIPIDTTNNLGRYAFGNIDTGTYAVAALHLNQKTRAARFGIAVAGDTVTLEPDTLRISGTIKIAMPDSADVLKGYFFIPGTEIEVFLYGSNGTIIMDSVPAGIIPVISYAVKNSSTAPRSIGNTIAVTPADTTIIAYPAWRSSKKLFLNTSSSGAQVAGTVTDFPVLVRLNGSNFEFSTARVNGEDIRFSKANGAPFPYEIERWDATSQAAEVWVKVDTVYGNDSTHFINMYWGLRSTGSATVSLSNSAAVFDSVQGNVGVWHLDPSLNDATIFGDNGIDSSTTDAVGIIGRCRHFDPALHSFITIPNESRFDITTNITLSAWVQVDSLYVGWEAIITKGDNTYRLHCDTTLKDAVFSTSTFAANQTDTVINRLYSKTRIDDHQWHFICGVFDSSVMHIYIDGILEGERPVTSPCQVNNFNVMIGNNGGMPNRFFAGSIDEVRILHAAMSADWVTLCYMNEKENEVLVEFK